MLARQVEAQLLGHLDVVAQGFVRGGGIDAVRPEALIERAELEVRLVVEHEAREALVVLAQRDLAHAEVALDLVNGAVTELQANLQVIQMGRFRRPELRLLDGYRGLSSRD